jgi:Xaa-Pro aminopeptidase
MANFVVSSVGLDRKRAGELIRERRLIGMLFTSPENVYYTTGAHTLPGTGNPILFALSNHLPTFSFVDGEGKVTLFVWIGATMGIDYRDEDVRTFMDRAGAEEELASFLGERRTEASRVGIESSCPYWALDRVEAAVGRENVVQSDDVPLRLRLTKSRKELELMEESAAVVERSVSALKTSLRIGISRPELAQEARRKMMENGATAVDHLTIAFGPSNPEVMLDETLGPDQLVTLDLGAVVEGYVSDNRRLFYTGDRVPEGLARLHSSIVRIVDVVGGALRPGVAFSELFALAVSQYEKEGLQPMFFHVGHSIGLQTEEAWISADSDLKVEENMVLNVELYAPDESGVMIGDEETFLVDGVGSRRITRLPREIGVLGNSNS